MAPLMVQDAARPRQRSVGIDAVRLLGILAVVVGHSFATNRGVVKATYTWHVPLFFFLSGYLWRPGRSMRVEWRNRVQTLARPYVAWLVAILVVTVPGVLVSEGARPAEKRLAAGLLGGDYLKSPCQAFWFVSCLFFACLLYRLVETKLPVDPLWLLPTTLAVGVIAKPLRLVPESIGLAVPALFFIAAGAAARRLPERTRSPWVAVAALAVSSALILSNVDKPLDIKNGYFGVPVLGMVVAALIGFGLTVLGEQLVTVGGRGARCVLSLAAVGLVVVLTHGVALYYLLGHVPAGVAFAAAVATGLAAGYVAAAVWPGVLLGRVSSSRHQSESSSSRHTRSRSR